jgi:HSP20 family protein
MKKKKKDPKKKKNGKSKAVTLPENGDKLHPMTMLHRNIDRMFDEMWTDWPSLSDDAFFKGLPAVFDLQKPESNLEETDTDVTITTELPGMEEKDVDVEIDEGRVTISGDKKEEKSDKQGKKCHMVERRFGSFERSFALPAGVKVEEAAAVFKKGVLTITIPKGKESKAEARKIEVSA